LAASLKHFDGRGKSPKHFSTKWMQFFAELNFVAEKKCAKTKN